MPCPTSTSCMVPPFEAQRQPRRAGPRRCRAPPAARARADHRAAHSHTGRLTSIRQSNRSIGHVVVHVQRRRRARSCRSGPRTPGPPGSSPRWRSSQQLPGVDRVPGLHVAPPVQSAAPPVPRPWPGPPRSCALRIQVRQHASQSVRACWNSQSRNLAVSARQSTVAAFASAHPCSSEVTSKSTGTRLDALGLLAAPRALEPEGFFFSLSSSLLCRHAVTSP
jgi:hypothetical protein